MEGAENIKVIEVDFSGITEEDYHGGVWNMDTGEYREYQLKNGKVFLFYDETAAKSKQMELRFDLVDHSEVYLQIDRVVINSKLGITDSVIGEYGKLILLFLVSEFLILSIVETNKNEENKKRVRVKRTISFLTIGSIALYIYDSLYLKAESLLSRWMFLTLLVALILSIGGVFIRKREKIEFAYFSIILYAILDFGIVEILSICKYDFSNLQAGFWNWVLWMFLIVILHLLTQNFKFSVIVPNVIAVVLGVINH